MAIDQALAVRIKELVSDRDGFNDKKDYAEVLAAVKDQISRDAKISLPPGTINSRATARTNIIRDVFMRNESGSAEDGSLAATEIQFDNMELQLLIEGFGSNYEFLNELIAGGGKAIMMARAVNVAKEYNASAAVEERRALVEDLKGVAGNDSKKELAPTFRVMLLFDTDPLTNLRAVKALAFYPKEGVEAYLTASEGGVFKRNPASMKKILEKTYTLLYRDSLRMDVGRAIPVVELAPRLVAMALKGLKADSALDRKRSMQILGAMGSRVPQPQRREVVRAMRTAQKGMGSMTDNLKKEADLVIAKMHSPVTSF